MSESRIRFHQSPEVAEGLSIVRAAVQKVVAQLDPMAFRGGMRRFADAAKAIGDAGWTVPMWATPRETVDILEVGAVGAIDDVFIEYYDAHEGYWYAQLKRQLKRTDLNRWAKLIEQCLTAYEDELYLVVIPAMITVIEGVIAQIGISKQWPQKRPKAVVSASVAELKNDSFQHAIWMSIDRFVSGLFETQAFTGSPPPRINRHWVLHGHATPSWDRADCLRLFQAVDTIAPQSISGDA